MSSPKSASLPPLDFSFKEMKSIEGMMEEEPRSGKTKVKSKAEVEWQDGDVTVQYYASTIKLNNNQLSTLEGLVDVFEKIVLKWTNITWIDLSFNSISTFPEELLSLPELSVLYLHSNQIAKKEEIKKFAQIPKLRTLTLHGNPVEEVKNYKWIVISSLPSLRSFDFSTVTPADQETAATFVTLHTVKKKEKKFPF